MSVTSCSKRTIQPTIFHTIAPIEFSPTKAIASWHKIEILIQNELNIFFFTLVFKSFLYVYKIERKVPPPSPHEKAIQLKSLDYRFELGATNNSRMIIFVEIRDRIAVSFVSLYLYFFLPKLPKSLRDGEILIKNSNQMRKILQKLCIFSFVTKKNTSQCLIVFS